MATIHHHHQPEGRPVNGTSVHPSTSVRKRSLFSERGILRFSKVVNGSAPKFFALVKTPAENFATMQNSGRKFCPSARRNAKIFRDRPRLALALSAGLRIRLADSGCGFCGFGFGAPDLIPPPPTREHHHPRPTMLTRQQRYSIATGLAVSNLQAIAARLQGNQEALEFATTIDKHYRKRDGFIPRAVLRIVNQ